MSDTTGVLRKSASITNLAKALVAAQGEMENPPFDSDNPHFRSRFCSLAGARNTIVPVLARHGLAVMQSAGSGEKGPRVVTVILHASGEWIESEPLELPASKQDAQGYGSALTYARRFSLLAAACVVGEKDDDAEAASKPQAVKTPAQQPPAKPAPAPAQAAPVAKITSGADFLQKLHSHDAKLAHEGKCKGGELIKRIASVAKRAGYDPDMSKWGEAEIKAAREATKVFEAERTPVSNEELKALDAELERTGETNERCIEWLKLPAGTILGKLNSAQIRWATAQLLPLPDAVKSGA